MDSEIQALAAITDYRVRRYLKNLIDLKSKIDGELETENLSVKREMDLKSSRQILEEIIRKVRFSGIL